MRLILRHSSRKEIKMRTVSHLVRKGFKRQRGSVGSQFGVSEFLRTRSCSSDAFCSEVPAYQNPTTDKFFCSQLDVHRDVNSCLECALSKYLSLRAEFSTSQRWTKCCGTSGWRGLDLRAVRSDVKFNYDFAPRIMGP